MSPRLKEKNVSPGAIRSAIQHFLKKIIKASPFYSAFLSAQKRRQVASLVRQGKFTQPPPTTEEVQRVLREWEQQGRPVPPPPVYKQVTLRTYARQFGLQVLIETGTYLGDTVEASKDQFRRIYSIELSMDLAKLTKKRFQQEAHITILQGDSEEVLPAILSEIQGPCLFWLDGHYSEGITALGKSVTPILGELETILAHPVQDHVLLIDDARNFRHENSHPTLEELHTFVADRRPDLLFEVKDDIIRMHRPPDRADEAG